MVHFFCSSQKHGCNTKAFLKHCEWTKCHKMLRPVLLLPSAFLANQYFVKGSTYMDLLQLSVAGMVFQQLFLEHFSSDRISASMAP